MKRGDDRGVMSSLPAAIESLGGIAKAAELLRLGFSYRAMSRAAATGRIVRVRCGWYASAGVVDASTQAARVGGVLTCLSAAQFYGLWNLSDGCVHVQVDSHARGLRSPADYRRALGPNWRVRIHWRRRPTATTASRLRVTLVEALVQLTRCQPLPVAIASWDSALHLGLLSRSTLRLAIEQLSPALGQRVSGLVDGSAESGIESIARVQLALVGIRARPQVVIGNRRVDLLIGEHLVIECDSRAHHAGREKFEDDRRRDAELTALGYRVLRFSYRQVTDQWWLAEKAIRRALLGMPAEFPPLYFVSKSTDRDRA